MNFSELEKMLVQYKEAAQMVEALEKEMKAQREVLKAELSARGVDTLDVGVHRVKLAQFQRTTLDAKAVAALNKDLFDACSKTSTVTRLTIN